MSIILASKSPRRAELLSRMGLEYTVRAPDVDETMDLSAARPSDEVLRVAKLKAFAAAATEEDIVIASDTVVVIDGEILGKPHDEDDAFSMLTRLSGRRHTVYTAAAVRRGGVCESFVSETAVIFRELSPSEIRSYIKSGEPMDKAGAYGAQGLGALFIDSIEGDFYTVMGLPVARLAQVLKRFGVRAL